MIRRLLPLLFLVAATPLAAQTAAIPSPAEFLGYEIGARFTPHHRIVGYFEEIDRLSALVTIEKYGTSYEGRPLLYAIVTSEANGSRLPSLRTELATLSEVERVEPARAATISRELPVVTWLAFGVHGDESSSAEAAMLVLHRLVTGGPETGAQLDKSIVIIDPLQNPDGRERYTSWFQRTVGDEANVNRDAFEHQQPWPAGRFNHYMIDMNRDWAWGSQKETRARVEAYRRWHPQVFVDLHEMSFESTYFFPPDAHPINANIDKGTEDWLDRFGRANAAVFTENNWPFFVGERFDLFYPGYGDSWPSLRGAVGMTYEVAGGGRAGTIIERDDTTTLSLAERAERHATSALTTVRTAAENREALLMHTYRALRDRFESARTTYLILPGAPQLDDAVRLLQRQGIDVERLRAATRLRVEAYDRGTQETREFPAGTVVVRSKQRFSGLVQTLMERNPKLNEDFVAEQRKKIEADESDDFYDITAWSVPLSHNLETYVLASATTLVTDPWSELGTQPFRAARTGYLIEASDPSLYKTLAKLMRAEVRFSVSTVTLLTKERTLAEGAIVIQKSNNSKELDATLRRITSEVPVRLIAVDEGWSKGPALGSDDIRYVREPRIALLGGDGTSAPSFGMLWHTLDLEVDLPHTVVPLNRFRDIDLRKFAVIVMPDGSGYADRLGKSGIERLQGWIRNGGTVVAVKGGAAFLRSKDVEISKVKEWEPAKKEGETVAADERYNDFRIPGAAFRTEMSRRNFLSYGMRTPPPVLIEGSRPLLALARKADNVITVVGTDPLLSGFAWPESIDRVKGAAYLTMESFGGGQVITFADDPVYRLFWKGTMPLFLNAVIYSPTFAGN